MTLPEVMIALVVVSGMAVSVFAGFSAISRWTLQTALRSEASRLMQAEAESLLGAPYANFVASPGETITSSINTSFAPNAQPQFSYPANNTGSRVSFTRQVSQTASSLTSRTLRVEVAWTWQGRAYSVSCPLLRVQ